ncbi:GGDEF domain-containing protein [Kibdelosporangium persicum]|uniref:GGDEF domain-containing diguanylate cyclase n=1 Tax=Kibdelosporangium persicum TaxID=2698649 RepID=A0ABX2EXU1_9PSEU|nr:GGDEF domain-containing protein [Kibdelosporangium persicum]NRN63863.1 GGDEF domain-containing diguanylate cyclase [Kibdelosporangium persicum]
MNRQAEDPPRRRWVAIRDWALWKRPRHWVYFTLSTEAVTLGLTIAAFLVFPITTRDMGVFALLAVLGLVHTEATRKIERMRRTLNVTPHINMTSVWMLPAALLLPPPLVAVLAAVFYAHLGVRSWGNLKHVAAHKTVTNATTMILSCYAALFAASFFLSGPIDTTVDIEAVAIAVIVGVVVHFAAALAVTVVALYLAEPDKATPERLLGSYDDNALELTTLCLGGLMVLVLLHQPMLSVLMFFPMFVLQRSMLAKQLEEMASKDLKTGLLNAVTWHNRGEREVSRAARTSTEFSVLMIDLDYFKKINDSYGHLAGDDMLIALADLLKRETRSHDLVGRFGGEEFVVLLAGASELEALAAAERIRGLITELVVSTQTNDGSPVTITERTASIGVAAYPNAGLTLDEVLAAADAAVYVAKEGGRNRVVGTANREALAPRLVSVTALMMS